PDAKAEFDGLDQYFKHHPSINTPDLMAWAQNKSCNDYMGADSATDGDLDIAFALLLADKQWGSKGAIDYAAAGQAVAAGILSGEANPGKGFLLIGAAAPTA